MTRLLLTVLTLFGLGMFGCADDSTIPSTPDAGVEPDAPSAPMLARLELSGMTTLVPGITTQIEATAFDTNGVQMATPEIVWSSSDAAVADVSSTGTVTAYAVGAAVIAAKSGEVTAWLRVGVYETRAAVERVELLPDDELVLAPGALSQVSVYAYDALDNSLEGRVITWTNTDATVATIGPNGVVTALAVGTTTITVECEGKTDSLSIRVRPEVARIVLTHPEATIVVGEELQLTAMLFDSANQPITDGVTWSSDHPEYVSVTPNGLIVGNAEGGAIITATSGTMTATSTVFVTHWVERGLVSVNATPAPATMSTYTANIGGVDREYRMRADDGVLAIRWLDRRYEMTVFGPVFIDGDEVGFVSYVSAGEIIWNAADQVFELWDDNLFLGGPYIGRHVGDAFEVVWQPDSKAAPATLVFGN